MVSIQPIFLVWPREEMFLQKLKQVVEKIVGCRLVYTLGNIYMLDLFSILYIVSNLDPGNDHLED